MFVFVFVFVFAFGSKINFASLHQRDLWLTILWQEGWARCNSWRISSFPDLHHTHITTSSIRPPSLQCDSCHLYLCLAHWGQDLSIPAIGRNFLEPSLLSRDVVDISRFRDGHWFRWSCCHGKNCFHCKMIKHTSPCLALTAIPLIRSLQSLLRCIPDMHLSSTSQGGWIWVHPGAKRDVQPEDCLKLVLVWMCTKGLLNVLQLVFGLTYSNLSVYLRFGMRLIVETFWNDPHARVSIPLAEDIETFKAAFAEWHPLLNDCWATTDGLKLCLQTAGNADIQECFYSR